MQLASRGLVRRQICQQHGSATEFRDFEVLGVNSLHIGTGAGEFCENLASTVTTPRARKLHEVRVQQSLETVLVPPSLETMQLSFQDPQTLKHIAALHSCA